MATFWLQNCILPAAAINMGLLALAFVPVKKKLIIIPDLEAVIVIYGRATFFTGAMLSSLYFLRYRDRIPHHPGGAQWGKMCKNKT